MTTGSRAVRLLQENPGLKPQLADLCTDTYGTARALAERDTGLDEAVFPPAPPWTVERALDETYWPDAVRGQ